MDDKVRKQLEKLTADLETNVAKSHDIMSQMKRVLRGENPVGELFDTWAKWWKERHGAKYIFSNRADAGQFNRLLRVMSTAQVTDVLRAYISDNDPFIVRNRHPLNLLWGRVNAYRGLRPQEASRLVPVGCKHDPACLTEAQHTERHQREIRQPS